MLGTRCGVGCQPPEYAITDMAYFPFYRYALPLKNLFRHFRPGLPVTDVVGNTDWCPCWWITQSLYGTGAQRKLRYADDKPWTTASPEGFITPCIRYMTGKPVISGYITQNPCHLQPPVWPDVPCRCAVRNMRVCEPFGPEQRKGLWLTMFWSRKPGPGCVSGCRVLPRGALCQWERCLFCPA